MHQTRAALNCCQALQKTGIGLSGLFCREEGRKKRRERRKNNVTLFIDHFLIKSLNRTLKLDNGHFIRRQTHGTKAGKP